MHLETISPSQITAYLACPRKFSFRYVEKVPPAFKPAALALGSAVHSALEVFHLRRSEGDTPNPDEIVRVFLTDFAAEEAGNLRCKDGEAPAVLRDQGEALVRLYLAEFADLRVVAAEWPFRVPLHDPETGEIVGPDLRGVFDLLLWDDVLVEIKTAARAYDEGTLARNLQFSAYAYAYRHVVKREPKLRVVALLKTKTPRIDRYEVNRGADGDAWFVALAAEVARAVDADAFPPNPGWPCADCEYAEPCRSWRGATVQARSPDATVHLPVLQAP